MSHDDECIRPIRFPRTIDNRRALARIDYRIGNYADIREALLRWRDQVPELARWTHRGSDDPGVALLDATAILGDILTFYQQVYANECFLRTATWRDSVAELVRLTGYRLAPAIGGQAVFAAKLVGKKPAVIPKGFPISVQLEDVEGTATFETTDELTAYPWLSELALLRPGEPQQLGASSTQLVVDGDIHLRRGDRLFLGRSNPANTQLTGGRIAIVESARPRFGQTLIELRSPLALETAEPKLRGFRIGRTLLHFGHNAPPFWVSGIDDEGNPETTQTTFERHSYADQTFRPVELLLEARVGDLAPGAKVLVQLRDTENAFATTFIRTITATQDRSVTWGPMTAGITVATAGEDFKHFAGDYHDGGYFYNVRDVQYHEAIGEYLTFRAPDLGHAGPGRRLHFYGSDTDARVLAGRKCFVITDGSAEPIAVAFSQNIDISEPDAVKMRDVELDQDVELSLFDWDEPRARLLANVVAATQGETQTDVKLGNGDARAVWQTFRLPKPPLTYLRNAAAESGHAPELVLLVDGREWRRVDSFFGTEPGDEIFVVREDDRGDSFVQVGDGVTGKQFPSGINNVVARFRTGAGAYGPLRAEAVARGGRRLPGLDRFLMPGVVTGGEPAEQMSSARRAAPAKLQSLGRLVSLADYEAEAAAMPGVEDCAARWDEVDGIASIVLTVLMERGRDGELESTRQALLAAERCRGPRRHPIVVRRGRAEYVYLTVSFALQPSWQREVVAPAIETALGLQGADDGSGLFGSTYRRFGQPEYANRIVGVVQNVAGVRWATVDAFGSLGVANELDELAPLPTALARETRILCDPDRVLRLDRSDAMPALKVLVVDGVRAECEP